MVCKLHDSFRYYVFFSEKETPLKIERESGAYLTEDADALYLNDYLNTFYQHTGIGITIYESSTISGTMLRQLAQTISQALSDLANRPEKWPMVIGYKTDPSQGASHVLDVRMVSRKRLTIFLGAVEGMINKAMHSGGWIHFVGGG
jgi:hypothetical protein